MTHPSEHLAPYVSGDLAPAERAEVEVHLATCATCREEVALAGAARDVLRRAPDVATPKDLAAPALEEMHGTPAASDSTPWAKVAPWVAAAAVIGVLAIALPRLGSGNADDNAGVAREAAAPVLAPEDLRLEIEDRDYDPGALEDAAIAYAQQRTATNAGAPISAPGEATASADDGTSSAGRTKSNEALACLRKAFTGFPGQPVRLVKASFQGQPAYLAYVLEGPGAGQAPDTVTIWVAAVKGCSVLSFTSAAL
jgi:hypothetical protein